MKALFVLIIDIYKILISPILKMLFGNGCRFTPTCSVYTKEAIEIFGVLIGVKLAIKRLLKCHPFSLGYLDPLPQK